MIKTIIFDMDGVLINTEPIYMERFQKFFKANGQPEDRSFLKKMAGASGEMRWKMIREKWMGEITTEELRNGYHKMYDEVPIDYKKLIFPKVKHTLYELKKRHYTLALASSSSSEIIENIVTEMDIKEYFSLIVSGKQFKESKPNPEIYHYTIDKLHAKRKECLIIEDSTYGIQAAKNAGITVAAIKDKCFGYQQQNADYLLNTIDEVLKLPILS